MRVLSPLLAIVLALAFPFDAHAAVCIVPGLPCGSDLEGYLQSRLQGGMGVALTGVLSAMLIFYAVKLVLLSNDENQVTESRLAYLHALFGVILVTSAVVLSGAVAGFGTLNAGPINTVLGNVATFFLGIVGIALTANIAYHGAQLIIAQDESASSNTRQAIIRGVIGLTIVFLSGTVVGAFATPNAGTLASEVVGFGNFAATIFGALCVIAVVLAGIFLVISTDEQYKDRAKQLIIAAVISLIVVISSVGILHLFL